MLRAAVLVAVAGSCLALASPALTAITPPWVLPKPKLVKPVTSKPKPGTRVNVVADKLTYDSRAKVATATGKVVITYGPYTLTATKVVYDMATGHFKANGSIVLHEPNGNVLEATYADVYNKFKEGFAEHVKALLTNDVTITALYAKRYDNGITVYTRATYTACQACVADGGTPVWQIRAKQARHDENEHTIYYKDMNFDIAGVPVLWLPELAYPDPTVKRRTGFLLPQFHGGSAYGIGMAQPFFWALSPSTDLTLTPMITTKQGLLGDAEWRQRLDSGLYNVHVYGIDQLDPAAATDHRQWRGAVTSKGDFKIDNVWSWGWNGTAMTDRSFLYDYSIDKRDLFTNDVYVTGLYDRSYISVEAMNFQTELPSTLPNGDPNREAQRFLPAAIPSVTASHTFADSFMGGEVSMDFNAYSLHRDATVSSLVFPELPSTLFLGTDQSRAVSDLHWQRQMITDMGQIVTPFAAVRSDVYVSNNVPLANDPKILAGQQTATDILPMAGVDMRWPFIAGTGSGQSIITPVAQVISAPLEQNTTLIGNEDSVALNFDTTNLFLEDKFSGYDRYEAGTRANLGLMYNYLFNDGGFVRASGGYTQHIAGPNSFQTGSGLNTAVSDFVGGLAYQPSDKLRFTYQARVSPQLTAIDSQEASASLTLDRIAGSLSYADIAAAPAYGLPGREEQIWGDLSYRLSSAWSVFGGLRYDLLGSSFVDKEIGVMFDCDCMTATLTYRDHAGTSLGDPPDRSVMLSVDFRTLGKIAGGFGL